MKRILIPDDEQNMLDALRREWQNEYLVETFSDPIAAQEHCRNASFNLIIADYQIPELNSIEFLKRFNTIQTINLLPSRHSTP